MQTPVWRSDPHEVATWYIERAATAQDLHAYFDGHLGDHDLLDFTDHLLAVAKLLNGAVDDDFVLSFIAGRAWRDRIFLHVIPTSDSWLRLNPSDEYDRIAIWYIGCFLRYNFSVKVLRTLSTQWIANTSPREALDPFLLGLSGFAELNFDVKYGIEILNSALGTTGASRNVYSLVLHAYWFASPFDQQSEFILAVAQQIEQRFSKLSAVEAFWTAKGFRLQHSWYDALEKIDFAFANLVDDPDFLSIHQDFVRERELIILGLSFRDNH